MRRTHKNCRTSHDSCSLCARGRSPPGTLCNVKVSACGCPRGFTMPHQTTDGKARPHEPKNSDAVACVSPASCTSANESHVAPVGSTSCQRTWRCASFLGACFLIKPELAESRDDPRPAVNTMPPASTTALTCDENMCGLSFWDTSKVSKPLL